MNKITIGRAERMKLVDQGVEVYAKVDSGAYYSSIDADVIAVEGDTLTYRLFREGKEGYSEQTVTTKDFKMFTTRSSNGHEQTRPLIQMTVELGGQTTTEWFSIANREKMFYPILIGRNILRQNYVIDVTGGAIAPWDTSEF